MANEGFDWMKALPNDPGKERDDLILEAIKSGLAYCEWTPITVKNDQHQAILYVCDDAVRVDIGETSCFRFQVSATLAQQCADLMGAILPTAKICDLAYQQATVKIPACPLTSGPDMVTTRRSIDYNVLVEKKRAGRSGLVRDCGKAWIISNKLGSIVQGTDGAINYGFYSPQAPDANHLGLKMWQNVGTRHNRLHTDYSQVLIVLDDYCLIDGISTKVADVMTNHDLANLVSDEGVLKYTRQPGVPESNS